MAGPSFLCFCLCIGGCASSQGRPAARAATDEVVVSAAPTASAAPVASSSASVPVAPSDPRERDKPLSTPHAEVPGWLRVGGAALEGSTAAPGARVAADPQWLAHASREIERALSSLPAYRPKLEPAIATTLSLRVAPDGAVGDVRVVAPSGTLLDLVAADALRAPFPARSTVAERLVIGIECRGAAWPETRGTSIAVAGDRPCRVASVSRVDDAPAAAGKVRPGSAP